MNSHNSQLDDSETSTPVASSRKITRHKTKVAKKAMKAAERTKVLTRAEIDYVGEAIHPNIDGEDASKGSPNDEEIEEIERNLRYHANFYNAGQPRSLVKSVRKLANNCVDFNVEMARIMEIFRISELPDRNSPNRGLI
ncbi:hypothetical protein K432DRAFT_96545 [Lepidopterella palustris CBS 459.81]|uniref:Uncharacterized protein n=1 Tax=Lepidopterella palustris CBS 459.81 TaxID=1314670 RepID=A0A8E2E6L9_9PEZI|nr:hypothetical protein K432DRAFT_96545 [Lepidopterella palustris CBS 459.81]